MSNESYIDFTTEQKKKRRKTQKSTSIETYSNMYKVRKLLAVILWVSFFALVIKGAYVVWNPIKHITVKEDYIQALCESDKAKAVAHQYVKEYFTYSRDRNDRYNARVRKYLAEGIPVTEKTGSSQIITSNVFDVRKLNDDNSIITVYAKVLRKADVLKQFEGLALGVEEAETNVEQEMIEKVQEIYVKVPIKTIGDKIVVSNSPVFVSAEGKYSKTIKGYHDKSATEVVHKEIEKFLQNFYTIYDEGTKEQISYFFLDSRKIEGYNGAFDFKRINKLETFKVNESDEKIFAVVDIEVEDELSSRYKQRFNYVFVKEKNDDKEERWYIKKIIEVGEVY